LYSSLLAILKKKRKKVKKRSDGQTSHGGNKVQTSRWIVFEQIFTEQFAIKLIV